VTSEAPPPTGPPPVPPTPPTPPAPPAAPPPVPPQQPAGLLTFACPGCGSAMHYAPGTTQMVCPSCGNMQQIVATTEIHEHSYDDWSKLPPKPVATIGKEVLKCQGCGATTETNDIAGNCQFCGGVLVAVQAPEGLIVPEAVVPFGIDKKGANGEFNKWVKSRWFAPNALKKVGSTEAITGTYVPHWTYDADTQTDYVGERGEHYYTTETFQVNGRTETRQVQHTAWHPASGHVGRDFDDVCVPASQQLPQTKLDKMGPWVMASAQPYEPQYLAGYTALRYDLDPDGGLVVAKQEMAGVIQQDCCSDIGGDEQRVTSMSTAYAALMFKLMLMPLWIASYIYAGKSYQVLINANTGEVIGDRPYSKLKIALAIIGAIIVIAVGIAIYVHVKGSGSSSG
jgi:Zn finger protein HypA/HybF involved in hydrogenase expression